MHFPIKNYCLVMINNHPVYTSPSHVSFGIGMCLVGGWVRQAAEGCVYIYIYTT